jgi:hypothetical protein
MQQGKRVLSMWSALRSYKKKRVGATSQLISAREAEKRWCCSWVDIWQKFCLGGCDNRTWAREAEESPLLEVVAREWLVKTQQAVAVVIYKVWKSAIAL